MPSAPRLPVHKYVICRGMPRDVPFQVRTWRETGYEFVGRARTATTLVVNHWTGAENTPSQLYNNLIKHKNAFKAPEPLAVHFVVDRFGMIFQMMDTESRGAHCVGNYKDLRPNAVSIGIEYIGRGSALDNVPSKGVTRERRKERVHGRLVEYDDLLPEQIAAGVALNEALCALYKLPLRVPEAPDGRIRADQLTEAEAKRFSGCAEHYHLQAGKVDCCGAMVRALQKRARELAGPLGVA